MLFRSLAAGACTLGVLGAAATYKFGMLLNGPNTFFGRENVQVIPLATILLLQLNDTLLAK